MRAFRRYLLVASIMGGRLIHFMHRSLLLLPLLVAAGLQAQSTPHVLNFTGVIQSGPSKVGQRITLSFTLNTASSDNRDLWDDGGIRWLDEGRIYQYFNDETQQWEPSGSTYGEWQDVNGEFVFVLDPSKADRDLFQSITGDLLTGTWARQGADTSEGWADPYSNLHVNASGLRVFAGDDSGNGIEMSFDGNTVLSITALFGQHPEFVEGGTEPVVFDGLLTTLNYYAAMASIAGEYGSSLAGATTSTISTTAGDYIIVFDGLGVNEAAPTPIPEPSTYGLFLGGLALAGAAFRRRRKA